jgi:hypothetical protein
MSTDGARLIGMWRLQSFCLEDSRTRQRHHPYGDHPPGFLTFHEHGRMLAVITPAGRQAPVTEQERAAAFGLLIAYSGRWRLEPPDQWITAVDVAWFEPWVGTEQRRTYRLHDDDRLDVVSAPAVLPAYGEIPLVGVLSWVRD